MDNKRISRLIEQEFAVSDELIYLNHAAVAPWPLRTRNAVTEFADQNFRRGSFDYPRWLQTESQLRQTLQGLINAPSVDDIALLKNTSEALSLVAYGLDWGAGDNVVITNLEFPSNRIVWESLQKLQVEVRIADLTSCDDEIIETRVFNLCDEHTRLISISSVQYGNGLRMDLPAIGHFCQTHDILFCVDAIQSVGALQFDVQHDHIHFAMADGHKWMLGPEGIGFFYCNAMLRDRLRLTQYGWHMVEHHTNFDNSDWQIANTARRFECGSPNMLGIHALNASLSLLHEVGIPEVERRVKNNTKLMLGEINQMENLQLLSPASANRLGGIVTFRHRSRSIRELLQRLTQHKIMCAERGGGIRFSPHFYTEPDQIRLALSLANKP